MLFHLRGTNFKITVRQISLFGWTAETTVLKSERQMGITLECNQGINVVDYTVPDLQKEMYLK
jgi:hypothetical protein